MESKTTRIVHRIDVEQGTLLLGYVKGKEGILSLGLLQVDVPDRDEHLQTVVAFQDAAGRILTDWMSEEEAKGVELIYFKTYAIPYFAF